MNYSKASDRFSYEDNTELWSMSSTISLLQELINEDPSLQVWAAYKYQKRKKIYTEYEIVLDNQMEPLELKSDRFEMIPAQVLMQWYKERYTQMCLIEYEKNDKKRAI